MVKEENREQKSEEPSAVALSVRQPWAWLIVEGLKPFENRDWQTSFRGPLLIHAAQRMSREDYDACDLFVRGFSQVELPYFVELKRGGIVGAVDMTGCVTESDSLWFTGPHGFHLENAKRLPFRPCRGHLGFFKPNFHEQPELKLES